MTNTVLKFHFTEHGLEQPASIKLPGSLGDAAMPSQSVVSGLNDGPSSAAGAPNRRRDAK